MTPQLAQLIAKLQEIFQINQPDLDFGIYRILNSRQTQINEFLQKTLPNKINAAFNGNFEQANNVYNHLYTFFSRYYDQGDFISQRRYKGDTYAIPYAGEEVMLHWANKDQYYTKSGESFSNYAFTLENGKKVQFRLVEADTAKDNRKDNKQARVFALIEPQIKTETDENGEEIQTDIRPIEENGDLLTIRFEYIAIKGTEQQRKRLQKEYILQAVEKIQNFAISDEFQGIFKAMPTEKNKDRTLLEKYLTDYTAKNTADYFIHKNLGKFLNQELDFYIKNEVMNLDNIQDSTDFSHIEQNLQTIKTIKIVAKEIIAFLAQLEDFQKKLWLKKKFVAGCHYLITLDHLTEEQAQEALDNPKQTAQWQALFSVNTNGLNATEICKNYPHLVVDTALFEPKFQADVLNNLHDLDEKTNGLLIHSDNFQALNLLQERYKEQVKCIYIDPPYNTNSSEIVYKNNYKHSSWLSLMESRVELSKNLQKDASFIFVAIDDLELFKLNEMLEGIYSKDNFIANISLIHKPEGRNQEKFFGTSNEFMLVYSNNKAKADFYQVILDPEKKLEFDLVDNLGAYKRKNFIRLSDGKYALREAKPDFYYPIYVSQDLKSVSIEPIENSTAVYPITDLGVERTWKTKPDTFIHYFNEGNIEVINENGSLIIYEKLRENQVIKTHWSRKEYHAYHFGTKYLENILGTKEFSFPKSIHAIIDTLKLSTVNNELVLDYFGGSGTTAHAVINLNREDNGSRKYILVEQGEYFDSVLKPRVQKVIFAKEWKDGKPQADNGAFGGVSQIVKVLKLESYEDTLNNLELKQPASDLFAQNEALQNDYLLHYMLDVESRDSLLNTQHFTKPFDYQLNIATTSAGAYEAKIIDLVETFNYLIGLRVSEINDKRENGLVTVQGTNTSSEKTLVIWRDCEKYDYDRLNDYLNRHKINPQESEFNVVYINGDHNVPTVFAGSDESIKTLKVRSIEAEFLSRMFG
ncbi:TPA: site-specific DNA-methyltransferase [Haemophilus influenzae]|uniref:site-specific DNA-methyltransferase n=1 Tax=Haemophilus influenzae TaxID=727 RepID=UPI000CFF204C|nr:site-specific DNA-methyltransferase [Haemophilus influenzae]MCK8884468.1 site-specific DNA-methyltransferase [Haemophilus influenzae]PRI47318.1 DNA methylase [Haemophilus influenzae]PRM37490.1 DNA methylase [Haemophilus influenzae]